jgi:hypothetical protein
MQIRYERRGAGGAIEREDEALAITWYDAAEITALLESAGFDDVAIEPPAWSGDAQGFGVRATASR